ncbi:MAG: formate dehydrogenase subunit gamma [Candidatus Acidiferrales bacterium]
MSTSDSVPRARSASEFDAELVPRYSLLERGNHWLGALAYTYCLVTGLAFWTPYLFWMAAMVGGGSVARLWHPLMGLLFTASLLWTFVEWRGDMAVDEGDRAWAKAIPDYIRNEDDKLPPVGRFNFGQKLFFWGIFYSVILLLFSGIVLWYTETLPWSWHILRYVAILVHASVALISIGLFLIHVYMSAILEEGSFASMIHGKVTRAWAWTFHRKWYDEVAGRTRPRQ